MTDGQKAGCAIVAIYFLIWGYCVYSGNSNVAANITGVISFVSTFLTIISSFDKKQKSDVYNSFGPSDPNSEKEKFQRRIWIVAIIFFVLSLFLIIIPLINNPPDKNIPNKNTPYSNSPTPVLKKPTPRNSIAATTKVTTKNVVSGIKVSWNKVKGATCYKVYRDGVQISKTTLLYVVDTDVKLGNGNKHKYRVVASTTMDSDEGDSTEYRTAIGCRLTTVGIESLTNTQEGRMKVTYSKNAAATGYVLRYSLNSDMSNEMTKSIQGADSISMTVSGLEKGKTYYVQVRVCRKDKDGTFYSGYCTTKKIKITM